jgi:hypothetical protein
VNTMDHPRRCFLCGVRIHLCMGFVLARDIVLIMQSQFSGQPIPRITVRELCGRCVFAWDEIAVKVSNV